MRGAIEGLESPHSISGGLPSVLQDGFSGQFVAAFDDVLAPVLQSLDAIDAYVDPGVTPPDFLPWLAGWVGASLNERWDEARQRELIRDAVDLYQWRGTARGLRAAVRTYTGIEPEIIENGSAVWSPRPGGAHPGPAAPSLTVRVRVGNLDFDESAIERIVADAKPAHVPHTLEIVPGELDEPEQPDE